jgi:hypothetical protein
MAVKRRALFAAMTLLSGFAFLPAARAQDASPNTTTVDTRLAPQPDAIVRQLDKIDAGQPIGNTSTDPLADAVDDLESTRATMDKKSGAPISLSVSGWALGQVSTHH